MTVTAHLRKQVHRQQVHRRGGLPTAAEIAALTGDRDRVVDLLRLVSLIVVIVGHSIMLTVTTAGGALALGNVLGDIQALQLSTWLLQILPLFFFAGAAASTYGWTSHASIPSSGQWLLGRAQRLLRPVFWYVAGVGMVSLILGSLGCSAVQNVVARLGVQLLWFLGAYLLVLATVPALQRIRTGRAVAVAIGSAWLATLVMDIARIGWHLDGVGNLSFLTVWIIPAIMGVAYAKRLMSTMAAAMVAVLGLTLDVALVVFGPYDVSLVTVPGQHISNMSPPSLLLAGHAIVLCSLAVVGRAWLARITDRPALWRWVALGNRNAMTLYLWHLPTLAVIVALGLVFGAERAHPHAPGYAVVVAVETVLLVILMVPVCGVFSRFENRPLRWWDDALARSAPRHRDVGVTASLVGAAVSILMVARFGLVGSGLLWAALAVLGALVARVLSAEDGPLPAGQSRHRVDYPRR